MGFCIKDDGQVRWPGRVVPYVIDPAVFPPGSGGMQQVILAINAWNSNSIIRLVRSTGTESQVAQFTLSSDAGACSSPFGRQEGGLQAIACQARAPAGAIMHEI